MKRKWAVYFLILFLIMVIILIMKNFRQGSLISPRAFFEQNRPLSLEKVVTNSLVGVRGTYSIVIKNFKTGESYILDGDKLYESGSLYKLWLMAAIYEKIDKGELSEDEMLSQDVKILNQEFGIDQEMAELTEGIVALSVTDALRQMIVISHNYAALLLTEKVGVSGIKNFLSGNGFKSSQTGTPPKTTALDIALFFEKLYKGELVNLESSQKMIELLKEQKLDDGLPKYMPENIVANKTGDIGWFKHDAGIVFTSSGDYIIVIMSESDYPPGAQERIALISKAVYEYFTK